MRLTRRGWIVLKTLIVLGVLLFCAAAFITGYMGYVPVVVKK